MALLLAGVVLLSACGQSGDLYLAPTPTPPPAAPAATPTPPAHPPPTESR